MFNTLQNKKVLVVEDEEHNWLLIKEFLDLYDIKSIWVESGTSALSYLKSKREEIAFIMLDMKLPLMSGYEAATQMKILYPNLPIIAQTAHAQPEDEAKCYASGCDGYISKPFTLDEMNAAIEETLTRVPV